MRASRTAAFLIVTALGLSACSDGGSPSEGASAVRVDPTLPATTAAAPTDGPEPLDEATTPSSTPAAGPSTSEVTATAAPPADPDPASVRLALQEFATVEAPTALVSRPGDDALYVAERAGRVRPISADGAVGAPILDISAVTATNSERGLLGIAWSPQGDRLYLSSSDTDGATRLEVAVVADGVLQAPTEILRVPQPASNHNGGNIAFGPDGYLYLGLGDGGGADDQFDQAQRPDTLLGSMLRLDVSTGDGYAIPADNPFADGQGGAPEVWAYGLRNPWRFSFDALDGQLWIADVGQNAVEEIDRIDPAQAGLNLGWPRFEGDRPFDGQAADGPVVEPVWTYSHQRGCSITGGFVYRGPSIPALQGAYLYTDFCNGELYALDVAPDGTVRDDVAMGVSLDSPVSFGQGPDLELYVLSITGPIHRITQE